MWSGLSMTFFLFPLLPVGTQAQPPVPAKYQIDMILPGPVTAHTAAIIGMIRGWNFRPAAPAPHSDEPLKMTCVETPGNERFVGVEQSLWIEAPLERVNAVLDDFEHYKDLSPGFENIHVVARDGNMTQTFWEKNIPFFFMPNMKYSMTYLSDRSTASRVIYRYQLKESESLRSADGLIVLDSPARGAGRRTTKTATPATTMFTRYDYIDPSLGIFASAPSEMIWHNSLEDLYLSTVGIKLKAEHFDWPYEKIVARAKSLLEETPVSKVRAQCAAHGTL